MKIKLTAEVEFAKTAIYTVEENGDIGEYSFDTCDGHRTGGCGKNKLKSERKL